MASQYITKPYYPKVFIYVRSELFIMVTADFTEGVQMTSHHGNRNQTSVNADITFVYCFGAQSGMLRDSTSSFTFIKSSLLLVINE